MKLELLPHLCCPDCRADLSFPDGTSSQGRSGVTPSEPVESGALVCTGCQRAWPIIRGVPTFTPPDDAGDVSQTTGGFARNWNEFNAEILSHSDLNRQLFQDWVWPLNPSWLRGRRVLEAGCGMGRWLRVAAQEQPELVIGFDYSAIAYTAAENTRDLENVHVVRADIFHLPFKTRFHVQHSIGVVHHTPDPAGAFHALCSTLADDGVISCWVYGAENNEWITRFVDPFRKQVSSRLPHRVLQALSFALAVELRLAAKAYAAVGSPASFAYGAYLDHLRRYPFKYMEHIVYDHLVPQIAHYIPRDEMLRWARRDGLSHVLSARNGNSWRLFGGRDAASLLQAAAPLEDGEIRRLASDVVL